MARAKKSAKRSGEGKLPKGFAPLRSNLAGFFALEKGNVAEGIFRGSFRVKSKFSENGKAVYRIELNKGGTLTVDGEVLDAGAIVGIDEKGWTKKLGDVEPGKTVFVRYEGKGADEKNSKGKVTKNGAHQFTIGVAE